MVFWVCGHRALASGAAALVSTQDYKKLDQFWRNVRPQLHFLWSPSCGCSTPRRTVQKTWLMGGDNERGIETQERNSAFLFLIHVMGKKTFFLSFWCFACLSHFLLFFCLDCSKSFSWSLSLSLLGSLFILPLPLFSPAVTSSIYIVSCHTAHPWPRYARGFFLVAARSRWVTAKGSDRKLKKTLDVWRMREMLELCKLCSIFMKMQSEAEMSVPHFPLFFFFFF